MEERERATNSPAPNAFHVTWDAFCNLIDDRPWHSADAQSAEIASHPPLDRSLLAEQLSKPGQYFFPSESPRHSCEIFWLKLCVFESLCRQVAALHKRMQRPLLCLDAHHVGLTFSLDRETYMPIRWSGSITLPSLPHPSTVDIEGMPPEMNRMIVDIPDNIDPAYISPLVQEWPLGKEVRGTALIESLDPIPMEDEHSIQGLLRIHFVADSIRAQDFSTRDVFSLEIPSSSDIGTLCLWARKADSPERGIVLSGVTSTLDSQTWQTLQGNCRQVLSHACANVYRSYSPVTDLYSLGVLLLRALIGSDPTQWHRLQSVLPDLLAALPPAVQGIELSDSYTMHIRIMEFLQEQSDLFVNPYIPDDLWWDGILIGLRAISRIPGFCYESLSAVEERTHAESPMSILEVEAEELGRRARIELFESEERNAAMVAACNSALAHF